MKKLFALLLILALAPPVFAQINIAVSPDSVNKAGVSDSATVSGTAQEAVHADTSDAAHRAHTAVKFDVSDSATLGGHVQIDSTLTVGVDDTGYDVNCYGDTTGGRLFWCSKKMALRAGRDTDGTCWNPDSIGLHSFATGTGTKAKGYLSTAFGTNCIAKGAKSFVGGSTSIASGDESFAWGCNSQATASNALAFGCGSVAAGNVSVALCYAATEGAYSFAIGNCANAHGNWSGALGSYVRAEAANSYVLGTGINSNNYLTNNISHSIIFGVNSTTPTMTIVDDTVTVDNTLIAPEIVGNLTGNATTASTCTTWTGSGTVNDSLAALRTDVVNLDATVSTQGDSLTALTADIASLEATKMDTSLIDVLSEDLFSWPLPYSSGDEQFWGAQGYPCFNPTDTVTVTAINLNVRFGTSMTGDYLILAGTDSDTLFKSAVLSASWGWDSGDSVLATPFDITPGNGAYLKYRRKSGSDWMGYGVFAFWHHRKNP